MIKTNELKGIMAREGKTQEDVARMTGMSPQTFRRKMKKGVFGSDEIQAMIDGLHIEDPAAIFFAKE